MEEAPPGGDYVNEMDAIVASMRVPMSAVIISKRNTGKSVLCRDIVYHMLKQKKVDQVVIMSNTSGLQLNEDYDFMPNALLTTYDEGKIKKLLDAQAKLIKSGKIREILLIMDDVVGSDKDTSGENSRLIRSLYCNSRHFHVSVVLLSQIATRLMQPAIRANSDYMFFSRLNRRDLETIWTSVTNVDKKPFVYFCETHNLDYCFILFNNVVTATQPADFLFVCKAEQRKFKIKPKGKKEQTIEDGERSE